MRPSELLRAGVIVSALGLTTLVILRRATVANQAHAAEIAQAALLQANQELAAMNKHLQLLASTDPLTGLGNRAILEESLHQNSRSGRTTGHDALLLLDLDRFKDVNDTFGHRFGDQLLKEIAARLLNTLGGRGRVARLGGDEFAIVLSETDLAQATSVATACLAALDTSFAIEGHVLHVSGSLGIAVSPDHGRDISTLLRCADVAMYAAKRRHGGFAVFTPAEDLHSAQRLAMAGELRETIAQGKLSLVYQPLVARSDGRAHRVEALVRWQHPAYGWLSPDQFIPLAEQTGLIVPLTRWVLHTALKQCRAWGLAGLPLGVAVNVSMRNLEDARLPELVQELLHATGVAPRLLTLEITETMLMADPDTTLAILARLHAEGVRLAIDDFGTGHSSLGYLKRLPVDELKIDQAFVFNLATRQSAAAGKDRMIVRSVIALAHALNLEVVAEGVETLQAWELLSAFRCNVGQGFYLGRPMAAHDLEAWARTAPSFALAAVAATDLPAPPVAVSG
jgi:diguanylate cyclase (GGDEF)-like protein